MSGKKFSWPVNEELVFVRPPKEEYNGSLDYFYDSDLFPELDILKENWEKIRDEILDFEKSTGELSGMSSVNPANVYGGNWTLIYLKSFQRLYSKNRERFPLTCQIIDQIPNCVFSAVSILPPNSDIAPHFGDTNGIIRAHLGLVVPAPYPEIAIHVGEDERGWQEGELMCFVNVHKHHVWNKTNQKRYVLMVDIVPEVLKKRQNEICYLGLGSQTYNYFYKEFGWFRKLPKVVHHVFLKLSMLLWKIYLPIETSFKLR